MSHSISSSDTPDLIDSPRSHSSSPDNMPELLDDDNDSSRYISHITSQDANGESETERDQNNHQHSQCTEDSDMPLYITSQKIIENDLSRDCPLANDSALRENYLNISLTKNNIPEEYIWIDMPNSTREEIKPLLIDAINYERTSITYFIKGRAYNALTNLHLKLNMIKSPNNTPCEQKTAIKLYLDIYLSCRIEYHDTEHAIHLDKLTLMNDISYKGDGNTIACIPKLDENHPENQKHLKSKNIANNILSAKQHFVGIQFFENTLVHIYYQRLYIYSLKDFSTQESSQLEYKLTHRFSNKDKSHSILKTSKITHYPPLSNYSQKGLYFRAYINNASMQIKLSDLCTSQHIWISKDYYDYLENFHKGVLISHNDNSFEQTVELSHTQNDTNTCTVKILVLNDRKKLEASISPIYFPDIMEVILRPKPIIDSYSIGNIIWHINDLAHFLHGNYPYVVLAKLDVDTNKFHSVNCISASQYSDLAYKNSKHFSANISLCSANDYIYMPYTEKEKFEKEILNNIDFINLNLISQDDSHRKFIPYATKHFISQYKFINNTYYLHMNEFIENNLHSNICIKLERGNISVFYAKTEPSIGLHMFTDLTLHIHDKYIDMYPNKYLHEISNKPNIFSKIQPNYNNPHNKLCGFKFKARINQMTIYIHIGHKISHIDNNCILMNKQSKDLFKIGNDKKAKLSLPYHSKSIEVNISTTDHKSLSPILTETAEYPIPTNMEHQIEYQAALSNDFFDHNNFEALIKMPSKALLVRNNDTNQSINEHDFGSVYLS